MDDYIDYRMMDFGAPFVNKLMLFGMGMTLSQDELAQVAPIVRPCYAAIGLANDHFSFEVEYEVFKKSSAKTMTNATWLFMYWDGVSVTEAKEVVRVTTWEYEMRFEQLRRESEGALSPKLGKYLLGLACQVSGNMIWSLDNPRYHPNRHIYEHDMIDWERSLERSRKKKGASSNPQEWALETSDKGASWTFPGDLVSNDHPRHSTAESCTESLAGGSTSWSDDSSRRISRTSVSTAASKSKENTPEEDRDRSMVCNQGEELVKAPSDYISSLPAKGARDAFIDALTVWLPVPENDVHRIKETIRMLDNASLMLDDIEDGSQLRRGKPATHTIFGIAHTINSAGYIVPDALKQTQMLADPQCMNTVINQVRGLYIGQTTAAYIKQWANARSKNENQKPRNRIRNRATTHHEMAGSSEPYAKDDSTPSAIIRGQESGLT